MTESTLGRHELPELLGIHHFKLPVSALEPALRFYERALGAVRIEEYDHIDPAGRTYAHLLRIPGVEPLLELRLHPARAAVHRGFDTLTLLVASRDELQNWAVHLTESGVQHSPILTGIQAWLIALRDPDGNVVRLYTRETHGSELEPERSSPWLDDSLPE